MTQLLGRALLIPARLAFALGWGPVRDDVAQVLEAHAQSAHPLLPTFLIDMTIHVEDRRFRRHAGIDGRGIARALVNNLRKRPVQGGSTLEQQLVRSITGQRTLTLRRKLREAMAAVVICDRLTKTETAQLLLHSCWFGHEMVGAEAYARVKGFNLAEISEEQASEMVAHIRYPEYAACSEAYQAKIRNRALYVRAVYEAGRS